MVVENYFPRLWGTGISDAIFCSLQSSSQYSAKRGALAIFVDDGVLVSRQITVLHMHLQIKRRRKMTRDADMTC